MIANEAIASGAGLLGGAGVPSPRLDARVLLAHAQGVSPDAIQFGEPVSDERAAQFDKFISRRVAREPLAYIIGKKEFWSLEFDVGPGALVPRPESETLVEAMLDAFPDRSLRLEILDLGTGTGCLLIAALSERPASVGTGIDCSPEALAWAERNLKKHRLEGRCDLLLGNWDRAEGRTFDAIFCNPPYIPSGEISALDPEVARYEPWKALDGGADGLDAIRALVPRITRMLKPSGRAFVEVGSGQSDRVKPLFEAGGLQVVQIRADLAGIMRCVVLATAA